MTEPDRKPASVATTLPFVLSGNVVLLPCSALDEDVRRRMAFEEGDFLLSHRHGRTSSQVIDGGTAALLTLFATPRTIADVIAENSRVLGIDPRRRAEEVLPYLAALVQRGDLVAPGTAEGAELRPQYDDGAIVAGWTIVRCVRVIDDSEVYEVRNGGGAAALKIARASTPAVRALFRNETSVLRHLDGSGIAPRPIAAGSWQGRPYVVMEWATGDDALTAAATRRDDRAALLALCAGIARAYAALHARGVVHGDVHPRNIAAAGEVVLLDFGHASIGGRVPRSGRAGVAYFFPPESMATRRQRPSAAGEQYALAALLYLMIAGDHYLDFRLGEEEMARQIAGEPPLPFASRGAAPWPEVERILFRALSKDPQQRYPSIADMAAALATCRASAAEAARTAAAPASSPADVSGPPPTSREWPSLPRKARA
ncbi:MAG TPA: phosphotransferase [Thermoanaerobaculia bacterium]|nr:phosphotransferase [Thermoanaerobaculia bacterium]